MSGLFSRPVVGLLLALVLAAAPRGAVAQPPTDDAGPAGAVDLSEAQRLADQALAAPPAEDEPEQAAAPPPAPEAPSLFELQLQGGPLMIPILAMALLVLTFGIERLLGLRRRKVLPPRLIAELGQLSGHKGGLDPRKAYKLCQQYPSAAASVLRAALLKVGRPLAEVEHAVSEASEREASKLYANVRPINLAMAISPLLGLLGTVQGMIKAFALTATGLAGANRAEQLAEGIYVALVTTFAGLCVAIPAAILAHYFEGRIQSLFREIDELLLGMLPQLERYEGKLRAGRIEAGDGEKRDEPHRVAEPERPAVPT